MEMNTEEVKKLKEHARKRDKNLLDFAREHGWAFSMLGLLGLAVWQAGEYKARLDAKLVSLDNAISKLQQISENAHDIRSLETRVDRMEDYFINRKRSGEVNR